jgi:hypothetical protein
MARRLHVFLDDSELQEIQQIAQDRQMTTEQGYSSEPPAWPESFWRAFGGVTEDFARPPQVRQEREVLDG